MKKLKNTYIRFAGSGCKLLTLFAGLFVVVSVAWAQPNIPSITSEYTLNAYTGTTVSLGNVTDPSYTSIADGTANFRDKSADLLVSLFADASENACYPGFVRVEVELEVNYRTVNTFGSPSALQTEYITLSTEKSPDLVQVDKERSYKVYKNAYWSSVNIIGVTAQRENGDMLVYADIPADIKVAAELQRTRYYTMDMSNLSTSFVSPGVIEQSNRYLQDNVFMVRWNTIAWASEYELEWTWADNYQAGGLSGELAQTAIPVNFKEDASRVRVPATQNHFYIPLIYSRGYVCVRVRPLTRGGPGLEDDILGEWSFNNADLSTLKVSDVPAAAKFQVILNDAGLVNNLNSQYSVTFSEDGKILPQSTYADGSLRVRQNNVAVSVADGDINDYTKMGVVSETIYDFLGRPAVSTLPGVTEKGFWYKPNYNLNDSGNKYSYFNFDFDTPLPGTCYAEAGGMDTTRGVSMYYSAHNPNKNLQQARLPDAANFPFTRVIYEADNASRPKIQSGVGYDHRIGSGHETQYVYGNPSQEDLNRLFGTDAGYAGYYQKSMIVDANNQVSITYTDLAGKTIATSLAGRAPDALNPLTDSEGLAYQDNGFTMTEDLLELTPGNVHGNQNLPDADGLGYTLNRYILVSSEKEYTFDYGLSLEDFSVDCIPGGYCADCVYDLEISLKDDCGTFIIGNGALDGPLSVALPPGALNDVCDYTNSYTQQFIVTLKPGVYNLVKRLRVNSDAREAYIGEIMNRDTCLLDLSDFYELPDLSDCYITCESCLDALGTQADFITENTAELGSTQAAAILYNQLKEQCESLCADWYKDECILGWEMMLKDVSPMGQYGEYAGNSAAAYPLSVFNTANLLPRREPELFHIPFSASYQGGSTWFNLNSGTDWRNPRFFNPGTNSWTIGYYDDLGNRVRVILQEDESGNLLPELRPGYTAMVDPISGEISAYPEHLKNLADFIGVWQNAFARSLVVYHPEYFRYEFCKDAFNYETTLNDGSSSITVNTYEYAHKLEKYSASQAITALGLSTSMSTSALITELVDNDPFFSDPLSNANGTFIPGITAKTMFLNKLNNYQIDPALGVNLNIVEAAQVNVGCGIGSPSSCITAIDAAATVNLSGTQADAVWRRTAVLYASVRQEIMPLAQNLYQLTQKQGTYTNCIGAQEYTFPASYGVSNFGLLPTNPCNAFNYFRYASLVQRFPDFTSLLAQEGFDDPPGADAMSEYGAQGGNAVTGKCPMQIDFENMLGLMAQNGEFAATGNHLTDMNSGGYMGSTLFQHLNGLGSFNADIIVSASDITIITAGNCTTALSWPSGAPAGTGWSDVYMFADVHTAGGVPVLYAYLNHPEVTSLEIPFTTCLNLTGCSVSGRGVCKPTQDMKDLMALMNALGENGELWDASGINLTGPYANLVTPNLKSILGNGAPADFIWNYASGGPYFILENVQTSAFILFTLDTINSTVSIPPGTAHTWIGFTPSPPTTPSPSSQNGFILRGVVATANTPFYIAPGTPTYELHGSISSTDALRPVYASECDLVPDPRCNTVEHKNLQQLENKISKAVQSGYYALLDPLSPCVTWPASFSNGSAFSWSDILAVNSVQAVMSQSDDGESSHYARIDVTLSGNIPGSFVIQSCLAFKNCDPCALDTACAFASVTINAEVYAETIGNEPEDQTVYTIQSGDCGYFPAHSFTYSSSYGTFSNFLLAWAQELNTLYGSIGIQAFVSGEQLIIEKDLAFLGPQCPCSEIQHNMYANERLIVEGVNNCCSPYSAPAAPEAENPPSEEWEVISEPFSYEINCYEPVVPFPTDTIQDPCINYLMELAAENAWNDYQAYLDSVRNAYRTAYNAKCMSALETFGSEYTNDEYHFTLYYYDRAGNLVRTVPPLGVRALDMSDMAAVNAAREAGTEYKPDHNGTDDALATRYRYNSLNQPVAQQSPDGGASHFWYDNLGRVLVSQNARQAGLTAPVYSYTRYDGQSRITEVGEMTRTDAFSATQAYLHNPSNAAGFMSAGYTKGDFVQTYYDVAAPGSGYYPAGFFTQQHLRKRVSYTTYQPGSGYAAGNTTYMSASYYSYDYHGNVNDVLQQNNYMPDTDPSDFNYNYRYHRIQYRYDLVSGKVLEVVLNKGRQDQFWHRYGYDEQNRLKEAMTSADGYWFDSDAAYFYYNHGPLARVEYGPYKSQGADYTYTIHGWLKGMNSEQLNPDKDPMQDGKTGSTYQYVGRDEYGLSLLYFQGDYTSISSTHDFLLDIPGAYYGGYDLYNGNIRAMNNSMVYSGNTEALLQVFRYDQLNRISSSRSYMQNTTAASVTDWNPMAGLTDMFRTLYSYDANGNIQELQRYDKGSVQIDRLSYSYTAGSNRLDHVADAIGDGVVNYDFDSNDPGNYRYDAIGNLVQDDKEEIDTILWNVYGKVTAVQRTSGSSRPDLYFTYDAAGRRIAKRVLKPGGGEWTEHYVHDAQGNVLAIYKTVPVEDELEPLEVYLEENILYGSSRLGLWERNKKLTFTAITETIQSVYRGDKRYELSDHLGNVHVVVTDRKQLHCGLEEDVLYPEYYTAEVKNRYDYYPFGMLMEERKYAAPDCRYETDTVFTAVFSDYFNTSTTDWLYIDGFANPSVSGGYMHLDQEENTLIRVITPTAAGKQYRVRFGVDMNGCNAALVAGNIQNLTTQTFSSSGDHVFYFSSNDSSYTGVSFYIEDPCDVLIDYVIVEEMTISSAVVCDSAARCSTVTREEEIFVLDEDFDGACSTELEEDFTTSCSNLFSDDFNSGYNTSRYTVTGSGVSIDATGGTMNASTIYNSRGMVMSVPTVAGKNYRVSFDVLSLVHATQITVVISGGTSPQLSVTSTGAKEFTFKAGGSTASVYFYLNGGTGSTMSFSLDDMDVCELDKDLSWLTTNHPNTTYVRSFSGSSYRLSVVPGYGARLSVPTESGRSYTVKFDLTLESPATTANISAGGGNTLLNIPSAGSVEYTFVATGSTTDLIVTPVQGSGRPTLEIDNLELCRHESDLGTYRPTFNIHELSFSSGKMVFGVINSGTGVKKTIATSSGTQYTVRFNFTRLAATSGSVQASGNSAQSITGDGLVTYTFTATGSSTDLSFLVSGSSSLRRASVDDLEISYLGEVTETVCDPGSGYRYGFNGQMKDDEVYGPEGTSYTAEYWQYDSRLGRRWNVDPKPNPSISEYAVFLNNPIWFNDIEGDTVRVTTNDGKYLFSLDDKKTTISTCTAWNLYELGYQWFEPNADKYVRILDIAEDIESNPNLLHFTWENIVDFARIDRPMSSYASNNSGDWKNSEEGANGHFLITVGGYPYWADAVGQIPFAWDYATDRLENHGDRNRAIIETIEKGREYGDGGLLFPKRDDSNGYDNYFVFRGARAAVNAFFIRGTKNFGYELVDNEDFDPNTLGNSADTSIKK